MDAITLLTAQHHALRQLLATLQSTQTAAARERSFVELARLFVLHAGIEEDVLYAELDRHEQTAELARNAFQDHHRIDRHFDELSGLESIDAEWSKALYDLAEVLEHHLDEEERELFPRILNLLDHAGYQTLSIALNERLTLLTRQLDDEVTGHSAQDFTHHRRIHH